MGFDVGKPWKSDLEPLRTPLGPLLGPSWAHLGAILGRSWALLGPSWGRLAANLGHLGAILRSSSGLPSTSQRETRESPKMQPRCSEMLIFGVLSGPVWAHLGPSWGHVGLSWGHLPPILGHLVPSWGHLALVCELIFNILMQRARKLENARKPKQNAHFLGVAGLLLGPSWAI